MKKIGKYYYRVLNGNLQILYNDEWKDIPKDYQKYVLLYNEVNSSETNNLFLNFGLKITKQINEFKNNHLGGTSRNWTSNNDSFLYKLRRGLKAAYRNLIGLGPVHLNSTPGGYYFVNGNDALKTVDLYEGLAKRWYDRQLDKKKDEPSLETLKYEDTYDAPDSLYYTLRPSITGDTLNISDGIPGRYYMQESYNLNDVILGARNRGDMRELNTEGGIITALNPFIPYNKVTRKSGTYIGIDKYGKFKAGNYSEFEDGDLMSASYSNNVKEFLRNPDGSLKIIRDAKHGNRSHYIPVVKTVSDDGIDEHEGIPINLITRSGDPDTSKFGKVAGGRVIMRAGNDFRLVSGSINDIVSAFEDMKKRNNVPYITFYTTDNGTFNVALRTKNRKLTSSNLLYYDESNGSGGNLLYLLPNLNIFRSDTIPIKNIRTELDESYKNGHPLTNQLRGIVNHHTGMYNSGVPGVIEDFLNSYGTDNPRSSHVIIDLLGNRYVLADPTKVTFHSGYSRWANQNNVNDFMLGVEFLGDTDRLDLTPELIQSYIEYVKPIIREYKIPLENIVTHQLIRDEYNKWARENGQEEKPSKSDINTANQNRILEELLRLVYTRKLKKGGRLISRSPINRFKLK